MSFLLLFVTAAFAANLEVIPGKAFGEVNIGDGKEKLEKLGFVLDRESGQYAKAPLKASLIDRHVTQVWVEDMAAVRPQLRYKGREFPAKLSLKTLGPFLGECERPEKGTGGIVMNCQKRGLQIATSHGRKEVSFAVTKN